MELLVAKIQQWLPRRRFNIFGKDSLINSSLPYYTLPLLLAAGLLTMSDFDSLSLKPFVFIAIVYAVFPFLDEFFSLDERNPSTKERIQLQKNDGYFRMTLYAAMIFSWAVHIRGCITFSRAELHWDSAFKLLGIIFIASNQFAAQFAVAH